MSRKYLWIPVVAIVLAVILVLWIRMPVHSVQGDDLLKAMPEDAALLVKGKSIADVFGSVRRDNPIWNELEALPVIERFEQQLIHLDSLARSCPGLFPLYREKECLIGIFPIISGKAEFLLVTGIPERSRRRSLPDLLGGLADSIQIESRPYENTRIYQVVFSESEVPADYHFSLTNGYFLMSRSDVMVEKAIRQLDLPEGIGETAGFREVWNTAGKNVDANVFFHLNRFISLASALLNQEYSKKTGSLGSIGNWAELDVNVKEEALLFNGFSHTDDSSAHLLNLFRGQSPREREIEQVLPANTVWFASMALDDLDQYYFRVDEYLKHKGGYRSMENRWQQVRVKTGMDIRALLSGIFNGEAALVVTDSRNLGPRGNQFVAISAKSEQMARGQVEAFVESYEKKTGARAGRFRHRIRIDPETEFDAWELPFTDIPSLLLGDLFSGEEYRFVTVVKNHLVFGQSKEALSVFVHHNILGRTLQNDLIYADFTEYLSARSHFHFFVNLPRIIENLPVFFSPGVCRTLEENREIFQKLQGLAFQFSAGGSMVYNNLFLKYSPVYREITGTVWESMLDTAVRMKPQLVLNHYTANREILVQDVSHNLYLLNEAGRILWKLPMKEPITGEVYQIDYYGNGKLQYLFNTRHQLHLIDRNGNYVERYPVHLRSPATAPMALFDYENNGNYRIFVASEDRNIYVYSKEGNLVSGWEAEKTEHIVQVPPQHFRLGSRDYIVFHDTYRTYILDRRGNPRVVPGEQFPHSSLNHFKLDEGGNRPASIVTTGQNGRVYRLYFDGKVEFMQPDTFSQDHYFEYADLDGNGRKEYIFLDGKRLRVFNANQSLRFQMDFEAPAFPVVHIYEFSGRDRKIGVVVPSLNRIYLINQDGNLYQGFPLPGSSPFTIGKLRESSSRFNLIVGGRDNFLMNYSVQ